MKKNYNDIIECVLKNHQTWNYYSGKEILKYNPLNSACDGRKFIKNFIELSEKNNTNKLYNKIDALEDSRVHHIISSFFLGIYVYTKSEIIKSNIDDEIEILKRSENVKSDVKFIFIWFITCLFHDLGYEYEDPDKKVFTSFKSFLKKSELKKLGKCKGVPELYKETHEKYFNYRLKAKKNDHGICASYTLYNDLCKIREEQENSNSNKKKLSWEKALEGVYNFAAWIILAHNIWYVNASDEYKSKQYKDLGLEKLILKNNEKKIKIKDHPFFFLFCLIDSIEPFKKIKDKSLLNKIFIEINSKHIIIYSELECGCHDTIFKNASNLNDWLTPSKVTEKLVKISLKKN